MSFRVIINQTGKMRHQLKREKMGEREDHREGSDRERGRLNVTKLVSDSNSDFHLDCGSPSPLRCCASYMNYIHRDAPTSLETGTSAHNGTPDDSPSSERDTLDSSLSTLHSQLSLSPHTVGGDCVGLA